MISEQEAYENLANAIVIQAADDYEKAYTAYLRDPFNRKCRDKVEDLRRFFRSEYYHHLTKVDGYFIRRKIEKKCEEKRGHQT